MDYGIVLSRAWDIVWKNKYLLGLGFLAALTTGGGGNFSVDQSQFNSTNGELPEILTKGMFADVMRAAELGDPAAMMEAFSPLISVFVPLIAISFVLGIVLWFVKTAARAGLVKAAHEYASGMETQSLGQYVGGGFSHIVPLLLKSLLFTVLGAVVFGILGFVSSILMGAVLSTIGIGVTDVVYMILAVSCLSIILMIVFGSVFAFFVFVDAYAFRGIVLQGMGVIESIGHGWRVFRTNLGPSLILGLIYGIISIIIWIVVGVVLSPISGLFIGPIEQLFTTGTMPSGSVLTLTMGGLVTGILTAALMSLVTAWRSTGFTLAYREMTGMVKSSQPTGDSFDDSWEKSPDDVGYQDDDSLI